MVIRPPVPILPEVLGVTPILQLANLAAISRAGHGSAVARRNNQGFSRKFARIRSRAVTTGYARAVSKSRSEWQTRWPVELLGEFLLILYVITGEGLPA